METHERTLELDEGRRLALKDWGGEGDLPVIALHGWMDNAASFDLLAPRLRGLRLLALDLPGHGLSSHRPRAAGYYIWSYLQDLLELAGELGLQRFALLGHSMGGAVGCLAAALFPERVTRLALLDSLGPLVTAPADAPAQMRRALLAGPAPRGRRFASRKAAERARAQRGLGMEAARLLGERGIARDAEGWHWTADRRLTQPNLLSMTEEQVEAFLRAIRCPALLISAPAWWGDHLELYERRKGLIPGLEVLELDGGHHQHMEGKVEEVAARLNQFLGGAV